MFLFLFRATFALKRVAQRIGDLFLLQHVERGRAEGERGGRKQIKPNTQEKEHDFEIKKIKNRNFGAKLIACQVLDEHHPEFEFSVLFD